MHSIPRPFCSWGKSPGYPLGSRLGGQSGLGGKEKDFCQWRAVHGSKGSIASVVKKRKEKNSYINNSI
jgi:hypothetical protein